jgi:hypothetical protein
MKPYGQKSKVSCFCCGGGATLQSKHSHRVGGRRKSRRPAKKIERIKAKKNVKQDLDRTNNPTSEDMSHESALESADREEAMYQDQLDQAWEPSDL